MPLLGNDELEAEVQAFLTSAGVDAQAGDALRACTTEVQRAVLARGGLSGARNPSSVLRARIRDAQSATPDVPNPLLGLVSADSGWVKMRGLPFSATADDVIAFFDGYELLPEGLVMGVTREGRPSGDAFVPFFSEDVATMAIKEKDKQEIGGRYIELFPSTAAEAQKAMPSESPSSYGASRTSRPGPSVPYGRYEEPDIDRFLENCGGVDDRAAAALRGCPPEVQRHVIDRGSMEGARNPSALVLSRIRDAEKDLKHQAPRGGGGGGGGGRGRPHDVQAMVEDFLRANAVDDRAAEALRSADPGAQEAVINRGDLRTAKNPSAALLARLRDAQSGPSSTSMPPRGRDSDRGYGDRGNSDRGGYGDHSGGYSDRGGYGEHSGGYGDHGGYGDRDSGSGYGDPGGHGDRVSRWDERGSGGGPSRWDDRGYGDHGKGGSGSRLEDQVEDFIVQNKVDDDAANALRNCPTEVQRAAIERGVVSARNPSSALLARIRDARAAVGAPRIGGGSNRAPSASAVPLHIRIEDFLLDNQVDEHAAQALKHCPPHQQEAVLAVGDLKSARNPSAVLLSRLRETGGVPPDPVGLPPRDGHPVRDEYRAAPPANDRDMPPHRVPPLSGDVDRFCEENGVDDKAAEALHECPWEVQAAVMEKGVAGARNPSSALLARIREMRQRVAPQPRPGVDIWQRIDEFVQAGGVDDQSADRLRGCSMNVIEEVLGRGGLAGTRNPSAVLLSRIRDAEKTHGADAGPPAPKGGGGKGGRDAGPVRLDKEVEDFLYRHGIDENCSQSLRDAPPAIQKAVMDKGLHGARNPSAALLARINQAYSQQGKGGGTSDYGGSYGGSQSGYGKGSQWSDRPSGDDAYGGYRDSYDHRDDRGRDRDWGGYGRDDRGRDRDRRDRSRSRDRDRERDRRGGSDRDSRMHMERVREFLKINSVDDRASDTLLQCSTEVQLAVMDRGDLKGARNPSAALLARVRDAQAGSTASRGDSRSDPAVEQFLRENPVDQLAQGRFRECTPEVQKLVMDQGVNTARNPSSALLARIKEAQQQVAQGGGHRASSYAPSYSRGGGGGGGGNDVEHFIATNEGLDDRAADALRRASPALQDAVIRRGPLTGTRNPSAALLSRLRDEEGGGKGGGGGTQRAPLSDRGYAPRDAPRPTAQAPQDVDGQWEWEEKCEEFLRRYGVDEAAGETFRSCAFETQQAVMERGLEGTRNPSSALLGRIRDFERGGGGGRNGGRESRNTAEALSDTSSISSKPWLQ